MQGSILQFGVRVLLSETVSGIPTMLVCPTSSNNNSGSVRNIIAPQAQLFETGKDRRVKTKALFKQVVKFEQIDPLWSILGENKGGPYCRKSEIT